MMRAWIFIGIFIGVLCIAFSIFFYRLADEPLPETEVGTPGAVIEDIHYLASFKNGVYTIKGTAVVPNACTILTAVGAEDSSSTTPRIRVELSAARDEGVCLQLPTPAPFSLSVTAGKNLPIDIYTNGVLATSTP